MVLHCADLIMDPIQFQKGFSQSNYENLFGVDTWVQSNEGMCSDFSIDIQNTSCLSHLP